MYTDMETGKKKEKSRPLFTTPEERVRLSVCLSWAKKHARKQKLG